VPNFDNRTMFLHWEFYEETLKSAGEPTNVALFALTTKPGADVSAVIADVEGMFANGPQRVDCNTEAEFQKQFLTMVGNLPFFVGWIGTGVLIAILLASINTMLMSMREQLSEVGIMKSLGYTDGSMFGLLILQSLALVGAGGALGIALSALTEAKIAELLSQQFPGFRVLPSTFALAAAITLALGLVAGLLPALRVARLRCVEALRSAE
jgi:putative ABC transport system permease protein